MFASKDIFQTAPSGGYNIARSVRLRQSASAYFNRTAGVAPTSNQKGTFSFWFKRGSLATGSEQWLFAGGSNSLGCGIPTNNVMFIEYFGGLYLYTTQVFRDPSAWYHMVFAIDTTQATAANRAKLYINGVQVTSFTTEQYPSQNATFNWMASGQACYINQIYAGGRYFDGYMAEFNYIDGQQLTPSSFGETDSITGVWKAKKYSGTYGTNGFYLNFSDNSASTAATIGKDYSGNGNNWTPNNISVTAGATYDSMTDVPTLTSATTANYPTMNPLQKGSAVTLSDGNLLITTTLGSAKVLSTMGMASGKYYCEMTINASTFNYGNAGLATFTTSFGVGSFLGDDTTSWCYARDGNIYTNGTGTAYGNTYTVGDVIGVAFDADNGKLYFSKNGTWQNSGNPTTSTNPAVTGLSNGPYCFGQGAAPSNVTVNFGQRPFTYTPPTGYVALNTFNLPDSTIKNGAAYMAATTYTGSNSTNVVSNAVNGVSFQPDFVWAKNRSSAFDHNLLDSVRGVGKNLQSNLTAAEDSVARFASLDTGGFTLNGNYANTNQSGSTYVGWQWKAGGTSASNTNGSITSTVSAGATQGFSVATYTGTGSTATVGHGLGVTPSMIIVKDRSAATNWAVYHTSLGANSVIFLNLTNASATVSGKWGTPNSTTFGINTAGDLNASGESYVAYCFSAVAGYSAFGSFTGNGSTDGPFVYTSFRPRWILIKRTDATANWRVLDTSRDTSNVESLELYPSLANAEGTFVALDGLSNGFKIRNNDATYNASGGTYIYACFAENPFKNSLAR